MNSHILIPKCILKRFESEKHSFSYYDVKKEKIIARGYSKSLNTQEGYYSEKTEQFLSDNVEKPISQVLKYIDSIDFNVPTFCLDNLDNNIEIIVKRYVNSLLARNPSFVREMANQSVYYQFLKERDQHDYSAEVGIMKAEENQLLDSYMMTFTVNCTREPFVLPINGMYANKCKDGTHLNVLISPLVAITFVESKQIVTSQGKTIAMYIIEDEVAVHSFNRGAFITQCHESWGYVISSQKKLLEELLEDYRRKRN